MVYSKPLGGKSRIVKLVREMKKKIGSFTWAVLYMAEICIEALFSTFLTNENKTELIFKAKMVKKLNWNSYLNFNLNGPE